MKDLAEEIIKQINPNARVVIDKLRLRPQKSEVFRLFGSNNKILKNTNWELKYTFSQGIKETIEWFSKTKNINNYKNDIYNI